ncbi:uncharacterized protein EKO05_0007131 [Ascochyta rabiei]|uniref:uncharacterized protein n=1 Tax=Didymella rabiei TaxID=5454 RepID=UPI00220DCE1E|nr:uncharacterized protein EKO05_0007131 [Ascochyta rabiei]UPX16744.1 hypothetical protein EKO05_0007131 [Ascochyta rabiei]
MNSLSSVGFSVAVKHTSCVSALTSSRSFSTLVRQPLTESSMVWHSSITTRSSQPIDRCRLMNCSNASVATDLGTTSTIEAHLCGRWLSYRTQSIPAALQRSIMFCLSATTGTTTIVTLVEHDAGSINVALLPPPVPIITTTGLFCFMMASMAGCCTLLNVLPFPCSRSSAA